MCDNFLKFLWLDFYSQIFAQIWHFLIKNSSDFTVVDNKILQK